MASIEGKLLESPPQALFFWLTSGNKHFGGLYCFFSGSTKQTVTLTHHTYACSALAFFHGSVFSFKPLQNINYCLLDSHLLHAHVRVKEGNKQRTQYYEQRTKHCIVVFASSGKPKKFGLVGTQQFVCYGTHQQGCNTTW